MPSVPRRRVRVVIEPDGRLIATATVADTALTRLVGLLGRASLAPGDGLVIEPCWSVHTCFMRFAIDVLFLDADGVVLRAVPALAPWRVASGGWKACRTVELPAGTIAREGLAAGVQIRLDSA
jgi:uncharacterized membrane protein (UPF0127 family)